MFILYSKNVKNISKLFSLGAKNKTKKIHYKRIENNKKMKALKLPYLAQPLVESSSATKI